MVSCFLRVCWAAAAGKLHLAASVGVGQSKEFYSTGSSGGNGSGDPSSLLNPAAGRRSRQSSTGSTCSNSSADGDSGGLYFGICALQERLCNKDILIACEALELLVTCLEVRGPKELASFYTLPSVKGDFIAPDEFIDFELIEMGL